MKFEDDNWNLNRAPTKWEHIFGSVFSILIFLVMGLFLYAISLALMDDDVLNRLWGTFIIAILLFTGSGYFMLRVIFCKCRNLNLSPQAIVLTGYIIGGISCALLALSILGLGNTPYLASFGLTGLAGSSVIIHQGKRGGNS